MKNLLLLCLLLTPLFAGSVKFHYYSGMEGQEPVPYGVLNLLGGCENYEGISIDLNGDGEESDYILHGSGECTAASAVPVFIAQHRHGDTYRVVFSFMTNRVNFLYSEHNGLPDIKTSRGTASMYECEIWYFNGTKYEKVEEYLFSANDEETCRKHPEHCPWKFE